MPTQEHFAAALSEIATQKVSMGLFGKCFAENQGDEQKTKAMYISLRAVEIEQEELDCKMEAQKRARIYEEAERKRYNEEKNKLTIERFKKEYSGETPLRYFGPPDIRAMHKKWQLAELEKQGFKKIPN